ncbi:ricin-type beta-trefoil lectin domain protein [Actinoplanes sp. KI2]|uniref:RICIN domain-containing protein n=1 Tax=Actinoplanes sp. KI2 TaxID=2983315 RepID=UPI0021D5DACF|nr:RICIN domain-containing protein [Actinoplanes sp. KI2]MCU7728673.1 ricin-type beta-trefoil lectin domain protein [Actinoplanes sp. KI2]
MTDDHGEVQDPLLVRPYLHQDAEAPAADRSTQTWPSATTREVRSQRALEGADDPTAIFPIVPPDAVRRRVPRRLLVVLAVCAVGLLGLAAAGFAAMRATQPAVTAAGQPGAPVPALTGPLPASPAAAPTSAAATPTHRASGRRSPPSTAASAASTGSTGSTSKPAGTASAQAVNGKTSAPPAAIAPKPPAARTGTIRGQNGLCLDLNGGVAVDFNHVQVADCNSTAAQIWTLATDGTLRVEGMCALVVGDGSVQIVTCDGRTTAQWRVSGQLLVNAADSECLADPSGGNRSGTAVKVATCDGSAGQRWSLP